MANVHMADRVIGKVGPSEGDVGGVVGGVVDGVVVGGPAGGESGGGGVGDEVLLARRVLASQAAAVGGLGDRVGAEFVGAVDLVVRCAELGGRVLVCGLGKSGLIGQKAAATLTSLGIPSHAVHPTEAAHGDLGAFRKDDVCIALSYSGETEEVVALASTLRQDGLPVIGVCRGNGGKSSLEKVATVTLTIGAVDDDAGLGPAPMCSTTAMAALTDALAFVVARRRRFTDEEFARRHPGGSLGGLLRPVTEVLRFVVGENVRPVVEDVSVGEALGLAEVAGRRPGALLLVDGKTGVLTGIFTDGDLRRLVVRDAGLLSRPVREVMTAGPTSLRSSDLVRDAVTLVRASRLDEIPVVDEAGRPIGILDVQDLVTMKVVSA